MDGENTTMPSPVISRLFRNSPIVIDFAPAVSSTHLDAMWEDDSFSTPASITGERARFSPSREPEIPENGFEYAPQTEFAEFLRC